MLSIKASYFFLIFPFIYDEGGIKAFKILLHDSLTVQTNIFHVNKLLVSWTNCSKLLSYLKVKTSNTYFLCQNRTHEECGEVCLPSIPAWWSPSIFKKIMFILVPKKYHHIKYTMTVIWASIYSKVLFSSQLLKNLLAGKLISLLQDSTPVKNLFQQYCLWMVFSTG